jgi:hypothetical protein
MKPTTIKIKIGTPCHENWDKMQEEEKGRFCLSCQKAVVDFSRMSNEEIIHYFEQNADKKTCGRIAVHQHNTAISNYRKVVSPWFNRYVAGFLMAIGFYNPTKAQSTVTPVENHMIKGEIAVKPVIPSNKKLIVSGRVLDNSTQKPIKGALVKIDGTDIKTVTDKNGSYTLSVPARYQTESLQLMITHKGHEDAIVNSIDISKTTANLVTKLYVEMPMHLMGDVMYEPEPTPSKEKK